MREGGQLYVGKKRRKEIASLGGKVSAAVKAAKKEAMEDTNEKGEQ